MQNTDFRQPENSKMKKFFLLLVMLLLLLIPIGFWYGIIDDRESYRNDAVKSVASSWGDVQVFGSPQMSFDRKKDKEIETVQLQLNNYKAFVNISTETRQKGIYKIPVYTADVKLTGDFLNTYGDLSDKDLTTSFQVADSTGFIDEPIFKINGSVNEYVAILYIALYFNRSPAIRDTMYASRASTKISIKILDITYESLSA